MRKSWVVSFIWIICTGALIGAGCTPAQDPVEDALVKITYTGDDCVLEGPELLKAGPVTLKFINEGDMQAAINAVRHLEGKTHEDMLESLGGGEGPFFGHAPPWTEELGTFHWIKPGKEYVWDGVLEPGLYTIACQKLTGSVWYCAGLTVVE